jgi:protein tyrosine phosphatase (PTP) superfamily phosphohydrolase (DUF442 family)
MKQFNLNVQLATLLSLVCFFCLANDHEKFEQNVSIGNKLKANRFSNIYFSGQPKMDDIKKLKAQGFAAIINLRSEKEYDEKQERTEASKQGLSYKNIAFTAKDEITNAFLDSITTAVVEHRKKGKVLIHCSSGSRAAMWAGAHFYKDHKYNKEKSIATANKLGLSNKGLTKKIERYFSKN